MGMGPFIWLRHFVVLYFAVASKIDEGPELVSEQLVGSLEEFQGAGFRCPKWFHLMSDFAWFDLVLIDFSCVGKSHALRCKKLLSRQSSSILRRPRDCLVALSHVQFTTSRVLYTKYTKWLGCWRFWTFHFSLCFFSVRFPCWQLLEGQVRRNRPANAGHVLPTLWLMDYALSPLGVI